MMPSHVTEEWLKDAEEACSKGRRAFKVFVGDGTPLTIPNVIAIYRQWKAHPTWPESPRAQARCRAWELIWEWVDGKLGGSYDLNVDTLREEDAIIARAQRSGIPMMVAGPYSQNRFERRRAKILGGWNGR